MKIGPKTLPFAVLICALLWGSAFPGIKAIYAEWAEQGIQPDFSNRLFIAGIRFSIGGAFLLLIAKQPFKQLKQTPKLPLLGFSLLQTYLQYICFYTALAVSSAVLGSLLTSTGSFWWLLLAPLLLKSPSPTKKQWGLLLLGAIGVAIAVYHPGAGSNNVMLGTALFLASTLCGAVAIIVYQKLPATMGARASTGFGLLLGGLLLTLSGMQAWPHYPSLLTPKVLLLTFYLSLVSAIGFGLWNYLTQLFPVNLLAGYRFLIPICAVIESTLFVTGETLSIEIILGGICVIGAVIGLQKTKQQA